MHHVQTQLRVVTSTILTARGSSASAKSLSRPQASAAISVGASAAAKPMSAAHVSRRLLIMSLAQVHRQEGCFVLHIQLSGMAMLAQS